MRLVRQGDIPRDKKWINLFFETAKVYSHPLMVKLGELFEVSRGNTFWGGWALSHGKRPDPGASEFHYLTPSEVKGYKLGKWAYPNAPPNELIYPAVISAKQVQYFVFTEADWNALYRSDEECYMFIGHMPRDQLPKEVEDYVKKGETQIFTKTKAKQLGGRGKKANETEAAKARARERKYFYGWYDLGGVVYTPIFATRYGRYKTRFIYDRFPVALSDNLIALIPRQELDELRIKALLAYLNSSFVQHYIETSGGVVSSGPIDLTVNTARKMPILDVRRLDRQWLEKLAALFDELEAEARKIGGASEREQVEKLKPKIYQIDDAIAEVLNISREEVERIQKEVERMVERRS